MAMRRAAVGIPGLSRRALPRLVTHGRTSTKGGRPISRAAAAASPSWKKIPTTLPAQRRLLTTTSSFLRRIVDRLTGGKSRRSNPFLENHRILFRTSRDDPGQARGEGVEEEGGSSSVREEAVVGKLDFSFVASMDRIRLWKEADRTIREARADEMRQLLRFVERKKKNGNDKSNNPPTSLLHSILQRWNRAEAPAASHQSVAAWMHLLYHLEGANAPEGDEEDDGAENDKEVMALVDELLMTILQDDDLGTDTGEEEDEIRRTLAYVVRQQRDRTGFGLPHEEARGQYRDVLVQLRGLEQNLGAMFESYNRQHGGSAAANSSSFWSQSSSTASSSPPDMKRMVSGMYGYLHLKRQQAQLLGYDSLVSQTFDMGGGGGGFAVTSLEQVRNLHDDIFQRLSPRLQQMAQRHEISSASTTGYLSPSGTPGGAPRPQRPNAGPDGQGRPVRPMVWQRHVTLEGALSFSTRLALELFGLQIAEDASGVVNNQVWDASVRLFHVHDAKTSTFLGSFYLDPLARPSKVPRSFATVLYPSAALNSVAGGSAPASTEASSRSPLVVGMSLNIEPPSWDTDPVRLRGDDILSLLHELGHVLDIFALLNSRKARLSCEAIAGHASLPFHRSEVLPKFMEHWMTDLPSMYALLDLSETTSPFSDDEIEASVREHSRMKLQELAQLVFYGELELRLFSPELDLQQDSILALQRELAHKYIPHDVPDSQSNVLTPLVDVIQETMSGRPVSWSRYVLGDVVSANLFRNLQRQHQEGGGSSSPESDGWEALLRTLYDETQLRSSDLLDPTGLWELYKFRNDID